MRPDIISFLSIITDEEKEILKNSSGINRSIYMTGDAEKVDASRLLEMGKLITIRRHTRFVHFPEHTHNYIEVVYMCQGSTKHKINGEEIVLREGELLFLSQNTKQEIYPAGEKDIAINFIIIPEFFDYSLGMLREEDNVLRRFIVNALKGDGGDASFIHFKVAEVVQIQNLLENLVYSIVNKEQNHRQINQATMGLLMLNLLEYMDKATYYSNNEKQQLVLSVYSYIEEHFKTAELSELAEMLHYNPTWLSKEIKKLCGCNFSQILKDKRLSKAAYFLKQTTMPIGDICYACGYNNEGLFHRSFKERYGFTPKKYRDNYTKSK